MKELTSLYSNDDTDDASDAATVSTTVSLAVKTSEHLRTSLAAEVAKSKSELAAAEERMERENMGEYNSRMSALSAREASLATQFGLIEETRVALEKRISTAEAEAAEETKRMDEIEASKMAEVPRIKHAISLYANITGIKFDYSVEGALAGTIALPEREEVHAFEVDAGKSGFEIAESLWGMMA
jgi:hypothetical protein